MGGRMTFYDFLLGVGIVLEGLAAFNAKDWAEEKVQGAWHVLGAVMPVVAASANWLLDRMTTVMIPTLLVIAFLAFIAGGDEKAMPMTFLNIITIPLVLIGIVMLLAVMLLALISFAWGVLRVLAYTPRGILAGLGLVSLVLSFLLKCK